MGMLRHVLSPFKPLIDVLISPAVLCSAFLLKHVRLTRYLPIAQAILIKVGVFPITDHYYEPLFNEAHLKTPLDQDRELSAINFNIETQLKVLDQFDYYDELKELSSIQTTDSTGKRIYTNFHDNGNFRCLDADYCYSIVRLYKPQRIVEIGCGSSSLVIERAIMKNKDDNPEYKCDHVCIEPYEMNWLESLNIEVIRRKVEDVELEYFESLGKNDILFIDSSHMIRPQGDVLKEYLEILPALSEGVIIHIHDIFTPKDYPDLWVIKDKRLWNEQYLVEAFLSYNNSFEIIGMCNYLYHHYYNNLASVFPTVRDSLTSTSLWLRKL